MYICCEMLILTRTNASMLLDIVDFSMKKHFCDNLSQLGWCAHYMLDKRNWNYYNSVQQISRAVHLTDFYWFNNSPNRFTKQKTVNQTEISNCCHCLLLKEWQILKQLWHLQTFMNILCDIGIMLIKEYLVNILKLIFYSFISHETTFESSVEFKKVGFRRTSMDLWTFWYSIWTFRSKVFY